MTTFDDPATTPAADASRTSLREWALYFAARGWHVFPITPGAKKPPVIDRWESRATTDPDQITHWWRIPYSIGIATGPSKLVVVDLDTAKPGEPVPERWAALGIGSGAGVLRALARQHATTITPTFTASTPSVINGGFSPSLLCLRRPKLGSIFPVDSLLSAGLHRRDGTATWRGVLRLSGPWGFRGRSDGATGSLSVHQEA
ncbi:MAG: bifunctional DNA primase/polymerase [Pseudonocardiaceae bacterium]